MSEFLQLALDHHLYLFPLVGGAMWLLSRWGAGTSGRDLPRQQSPGRPAQKTASGRGEASGRNSSMNRTGNSVSALELRTQLTDLQAQREGLVRKITALEAESGRAGAASPKPVGSVAGRRRKRHR